MFVICVWEVPSSNLCLESDRFPHHLQTIPMMVPSVKRLSAALHIFSNLLRIIMKSFHDTVWFTDSCVYSYCVRTPQFKSSSLQKHQVLSICCLDIDSMRDVHRIGCVQCLLETQRWAPLPLAVKFRKFRHVLSQESSGHPGFQPTHPQYLSSLPELCLQCSTRVEKFWRMHRLLYSLLSIVFNPGRSQQNAQWICRVHFDKDSKGVYGL
jgi:hypothetical protein